MWGRLWGTCDGAPTARQGVHRTSLRGPDSPTGGSAWTGTDCRGRTTNFSNCTGPMASLPGFFRLIYGGSVPRVYGLRNDPLQFISRPLKAPFHSILLSGPCRHRGILKPLSTCGRVEKKGRWNQLQRPFRAPRLGRVSQLLLLSTNYPGAYAVRHRQTFGGIK
jgi:hypothetical protein